MLIREQLIPFGKYVLLERINVGGMAEVFKGKAFGVEGFERLVAVKRILPSIAEDTDFITMFVDEAKISVQLTHANIAQIFDLGKVDDSYFIAMEYVHGKDLRATFDRMRRRGENIPVPMCCYVAMKICEGLDYAHNKRDPSGRELHLIHRDVSPQNIILSFDGEVKLIDFGIAKAAGKAGTTQAGMLKGKFGYMSPEQVRGLPLDRRSDIFALGILLYEILTGERLFVGESDFATLEKVKNADIIPPSTFNPRIPEELESIVLRALAKETGERYQTAMDLHDDLQSFMYTSGNFFARKDLSQFISALFAEDLAKEKARDEQYRKLATLGGGKAHGSPQTDDIPTPGLIPPSSSRSTTPERPRASDRSQPSLVGSRPPPDPMEAPTVDESAPAVSMEWEEEELATEIYDKPGQLRIPPTVPEPPRRDSSGLTRSELPQSGVSSAGPGASRRPPSSSIPPPPPPSRVSHAPGGLGTIPTQTESARPTPPPPPPPRPSQPAMDFAPSLDVGSAIPGWSPPALGSGPPPTFSTEEPKRRSGRRIGLMTAVFMSPLLLVFMIAGLYWALRGEEGTLIFTIVPADAVVRIDGQSHDPQAKGAFRIELPTGNHTVEVSQKGYVSASIPVRIEGDGIQTLDPIVLRKEGAEGSSDSRAGFRLRTSPGGAEVYLNDRIVGTTPLELLNLTPGEFALRVEKEGNYAPYETRITIREGETVAIPEVVLQRDHAVVHFQSDPPGAQVYLTNDGSRESVGATPATAEVQVSRGQWTVEMEKKGFSPWRAPLTVPPTEDEITVEGRLDKVPSSGTSNHRPARPSPGPRPPEPQEPTPTKAPSSGTGTLQINTRPWSTVYLDGRAVGNTPWRDTKLQAGSHRITLVNPDFNIRKTITVEIQPGQTITKSLTLTP